MNQNFSKSKILHESSKLKHLNGGGGGRFWTSQKFGFPTIITFVIFWTGSKNSLDYLEKKYGNIGYFCSSIAILLEFYWKSDNNFLI